MKALIVRLSSIGDVVHTLPALAALHSHGWTAGWLVEPAARPLLEGNPPLTHLVPVPAASRFSLGSAGTTLASIREQGYDVALDFQGLWKSAGWARLTRAARVIGFSAAFRREPSSHLLLGESVGQPREAVHVIDKNLSLLGALGIRCLGRREFPLPPSEREAEAVAEQLERMNLARFAILNPGGGWASKLWPPDAYGLLAHALREHLPSLVTWGPGEEALADAVVTASAGAAQRSFPTTLLEYLELARRAAVVVGADTGPLHIACAVGAPVVGIYGPTDPARNGPFSPDDLVVRRAPPCAPCHRRVCERHQGVMATIEPQEVLHAVLRRLESAAAGAPRTHAR